MMKKIILICIALIMLSCSHSNDDRIKKFTDIYYEILMAREMYLDTALANKKVNEILTKYGYNQNTYRDETIELFKDNREGFVKLVDSVRKRAETKIIDMNKPKQN